MYTWQDIEEQENPTYQLIKCKDCRKDFKPTSDNEKYCTRCNAMFEAEMEDKYNTLFDETDSDEDC